MRINPSDNKKVELRALRPKRKEVKKTKKKIGRLRRFLVKVKLKVKPKIPSPFRQKKVHKTSGRSRKDFYKSIGNKENVIIHEDLIEQDEYGVIGRFKNSIVSVYKQVKKRIIKNKDSDNVDNVFMEECIKIEIVLREKTYNVLKLTEINKKSYLIKIPIKLNNPRESSDFYGYEEIQNDELFLSLKKNKSNLNAIVEDMNLTMSSFLMRIHNRFIENKLIYKKIPAHVNIISVDFKKRIMLFSGVPLIQNILYGNGWYKNKKQWYRSRVFHIIRQIIAGLAHLHAHDIAHMNINTNTIFINQSFDIVITDFSSANHVQSQEVVIPHVANKKYQPCEALLNNITSGCKVDIWSMGVVLFEFLSGKTFTESKDIISEAALLLNCTADNLYKESKNNILFRVQRHMIKKIDSLIKSLTDEIPRRFSKKDLIYLNVLLVKMLKADEDYRINASELSQYTLLGKKKS